LQGESLITKTILVTAIFLALNTSVSFGQMDQEVQKKATEAQRAEMRKLDLSMEKWEGSGWIQQSVEKQAFTGTENVQRKLVGRAILVEGKFTNKESRYSRSTGRGCI
jgi:hypothetical protein